MTEFDEITLHRIEPNVSIHVSEGKIYFSSNQQTVPEWNSWTEKVDKTLEHYGLKAKPVSPTGTKSYGGHPFLVKNLKAINSHKRGYIKRPPWFLRWCFDGVVTKERYES